MYCRNCGSLQVDHARFCSQCGTRTDDGAGNEADPAEDTPRAVRPASSQGGSRRPRRLGRILTASIATVIIVAALAVAGWREGWPPAVFGSGSSSTAAVHGVPTAAVSAVANLVSRDLASVRDALAIGYSGQISAADLAPAGTHIQVQPNTWEQHDGDARLRAMVTVPGRAPVTEVIYLVREGGRWRILFTDAP